MNRGPAQHGRTRQVSGEALFIGLIIVLAPPGAAGQNAAPAPEAPATFQPPAVSDPMLAPPPRAARDIRSWDEALALVRAQAPDYRAAYERVRQAQARTRIAVAGALPVINGTGSYTHQFFTEDVEMGGDTVEVPPQDVFSASANLRVPVIDLRAWYGIGTGERAERAQQLSFAEQRRQIAIAVVQAMLSELAAQRVAELNRTGLRAALERLALAEARLKYGQGTALDVDRAQQDVASARMELINGDESLQEARETLGNVLGSDEPLGTSEKLDLEAFERAVAQSCKLAPNIEQRPDVAAARMRFEVAERMIGDAERQYLPSLDLVSSFNYASRAQFGPKTVWNVQGVLNIPIYDGARYGVTEENRALAEQARQDLIATRIAAVTALARAQRLVKVSEAARDVARQQRELATRIDTRIRQGYAGGIGTSLDLVVAAQALRLAEIRLALLEFDVGKARAGAVLANAECSY